MTVAESDTTPETSTTQEPAPTTTAPLITTTSQPTTTVAPATTEAPTTTAASTTTVAPTPTQAQPLPSSGRCHPSYAPCVPVAEDVDCAGGEGDGPEFVEGPITITGADVYGLDGRPTNRVGCD